MTGPFTGRVGEASYFVVGDENRVRRLSVDVNVSQEPPAVAQRLKFGALCSLAKGMKRVLRKGFPERPKNWTPGNSFVVENLPAVDVELETESDEDDKEVVVSSTTTVDFTKLRCAKGGLRTPKVTASFDAESHTLSFTGVSNASEFWGNEKDVVYAVVVEETSRVGFLVRLGMRGEGGMQSVELPEEWEKERVHAYAFATSAKGAEASAPPCFFSGRGMSGEMVIFAG